MNEVQRRVLRAHHGDILKNLVLDTDILGFFLQKDILTEAMVHSIQAKTSQHEKIAEMLFMLPKRGPRAFPLFLEAVRKHSSYLGDKLEQEYDKEMKLSKWAEKVSQKTHPDVNKSVTSHEDVSLEETVQADQPVPHLKLPPETPIEKPAEKSHSPDKAMDADKPPDKRPQPQPHDNKPLQLSPASIKPGSGSGSTRKRSMSISSTNHVMTSSIMQQNLNNLYTKLKTKLESKNVREPSTTSNTPEPATFKTIDKLLDDIFTIIEEQDTIFSQCQALLGGKDRNYPLVSHVINLQRSKREMEQELRSKEQQKNKYGDHISKLENRCRNQCQALLGGKDRNYPLVSHVINLQRSKREMEQELRSKEQQKNKYGDHISKLENRCRNQATEISQLNAEVKKLKEELDLLQIISGEREEKQKIIDELRKMVMDADTSKKGKLRSSYLALHYDGNVTEIKQLRAEIRNLKADNENLKTENLMLLKSDNMKKLMKLREEGVPRHEESGSSSAGQAMSYSLEESQSRESSRSRTRPMYPVQPAMLPATNTLSKSMDTDKLSGSYLSGQKPTRSFMSASVEQLTSLETEQAAPVIAKQQPKAKDLEMPNLDFKFSNQNGSLGQKRSSSKDRLNKRVTFYGDIDDDGSVGIVRETSVTTETLTSEFNASSHKGSILVNGTLQPVPGLKTTANPKVNVNETLQAASSKPATNPKEEKKALRGRPPKLKSAKSSSKRSASLNSITSNRDIIKMSSHLIQRSRNLRQPVGH